MEQRNERSSSPRRQIPSRAAALLLVSLRTVRAADVALDPSAAEVRPRKGAPLVPSLQPPLISALSSHPPASPPSAASAPVASLSSRARPAGRFAARSTRRPPGARAARRHDVRLRLQRLQLRPLHARRLLPDHVRDHEQRQSAGHLLSGGGLAGHVQRYDRVHEDQPVFLGRADVLRHRLQLPRRVFDTRVLRGRRHASELQLVPLARILTSGLEWRARES